MSRNRKPRRLWLQIKAKAPGSSRRNVIVQLIRSIHKGDYRYPKEWRVQLSWSNRENGEMRKGEFTREMKQSRQSSPGFDMAVEAYLESQL